MATSTTAMSVREKQISALTKMLQGAATVSNKSSAAAGDPSVDPQWKILIYDRYGQDIISPLLSVKQLRDLGVTLHLPLHTSDRDPVPDVSAIYFMMPTTENLQRLYQDFRNEMYDSYSLNFISTIDRRSLEELAQYAVQYDVVDRIEKVCDQYLNFISLEDDLFCVCHQNKEPISFYALNKGDVSDNEMAKTIDVITGSLFSTFVTIGQVPIIRCPKNCAAEMVARQLDAMFRQNMTDSRCNQFSVDVAGGRPTFTRPLLVILDRTFDLATPLHHTWTYQALVHDTLNMALNQVTIEEKTTKTLHGASPASSITKKSLSLSASDKFWQQYKGCPFPEVAKAVQEELEAYRQSEGEVKKLKVTMGLDPQSSDDAISMISDDATATSQLTSAMDSLPNLLEKKRLIDLHTTVATAVLDQIKARKLDVYFEHEEKIMSKGNVDKAVSEILRTSNGSVQDKIRLLIICYVCGGAGGGMSDVELDQMIDLLSEEGDVSAVRFLRRQKAHSKVNADRVEYAGGGISTVSMFNKLVSQGSEFVMEGVKNLVVKKHKLPVTKIADTFMEMKTSPETENYLYFDPKLRNFSDNNNIALRNKDAYSEALVFIVGGGNYVEYQNLVDYGKDKNFVENFKKITYGCTEMLNADQLLKQITQLGIEM